MMYALRHPIQFRRDHRFTLDRASDYLDGELSASDADRVDRHASMCPPCRKFLVSLRRTLTGLRTLSVDLTPAPGAPTAASVIDALRAEPDSPDPDPDPGPP